MHGEVEAGTGFQQVLYFFVSFNAAESDVEVGKDNLRYSKPQQPGYFTADDFGNKGFGSLAGATKF